jgi:hypothetical protein
VTCRNYKLGTIFQRNKLPPGRRPRIVSNPGRNEVFRKQFEADGLGDEFSRSYNELDESSANLIFSLLKWTAIASFFRSTLE